MRTCIAITLFSMLTIGGGCVPDNSDSPLVILYNQLPSEGCTVSDSDGGTALGRGNIDTLADTGYLFSPVLKNFAQTTDYIDIDQRIAYIEGAVIGLNVDDGQSFAYTTRFGAAVEPDGGTRGLHFELIPLEILQTIGGTLAPNTDRATIQVTVRMFGLLGGGNVETQDFNYTIDACNGCLVNLLSSCDDTVQNAGGPCNALQDTSTVVDCCQDATGKLLCPAAPLPPPVDPM